MPEMHGTVCKRQTKAASPDLSKDGDVILGGIFTIHLDVINDFHSYTFTPKSSVCKSFGFASFRLAQTMIFAIEEINQNENLLPGITLGCYIHDDCSSSAIASKAAFALINGEEESMEYTECRGSSNVAAIVVCGPSTNSIVTARTIGSFGIPLVSYFSTCSCLSDKTEYPTFIRTIPSDQYQSKILAELVKTFGWTWIGTIRSNTDYGIFGMQGFVKHVETFGVCIAYSESFYRTDPPEKISKIVQVIKEASTKVVVAFAHGADMRILLNEMLRENVTGIQWIGSEAWVSENLLPPEERLLHYIRTVNFTAKTGEIVYFDENGDPVPRYEFVNLQTNLNGIVEIVNVGYYDGSAPPGSELQMQIDDIVWSTTGKTEDGKPIQGSQETVDVCFTLGIAVIFYRNRETPVVKANNAELSFLLLFALLLCFICSLAFIGEPTEWSCILRRTAFGIVFVLCISCILGKTIIVVVAFKATLPNSSMMSCFGPTQQRLGVFVLTFLQSIVCIFWLSLSPPYPLKNMSHYRDIIILECDAGSLTAFYVVSSYIALLSIVCLVLAFLARKLPDSFNDAKYITFSMLIFCAVWITFIPAYVSSPGKYTVAVEVFAIWASSFGLLVCIFAPKCYIILLKPEINSKKHMMAKGTSL
ncbi:extracellular calcium-sensing receptor-like [Hypanus sabinus]|uniref:extracellular calcium-sensing receptor-like n=1 Tax=Hypanus sabinus TaxID=79690 RepID=UPI0028C4B0E4|nr:extracellular calcium-sensing receptor-like [Hypanus sabinus]